MEFSTKVNIPKSTFTITHSDKLLLLGSCFTENIGIYLNNYQFKTTVNPAGIIYNPISIFNCLCNIIDKRLYTENDLQQYNELFISFDHHGYFSGVDKEQVLEKINSEITSANAIFEQTKYIIITLGTSYVYRHIEQNRVVANCHKLPGKQFEKQLLRIEEIVNAFNKIILKLKDKIILFTVSPVRHWRDGAIENQRSKSILIESIHQLIAKHHCFYFPAYEIMMDELRDYRFYTEDMLHPNGVAVKYIWQLFSETYFTKETQNINKKIEKINLLVQHKIKHAKTKEEEIFLKQRQQEIEDFKRNFPQIDPKF